jgi:ERCC4-type nuclease
VPIIYTKNPEDTANFIKVLANKKDKESSLNPNKKTLNKKQRMQYILESFRGIGPKTAKKLLKKLKTLTNIFNSSEDLLEEMIGKKKEAFKILEEKY